ncbi:MAG TPA: tRNA 2-thiouridine(34) synthase MnmA [Verrucomicrobiae bacterium]|nr:tRNA 2-thiouridine(34) synthase MnmA [Verrucomicrobiae bacterium]
MSGGKGRVVIAMSGGVDSSVAAALLCDQGYEVIGVSMQVWDYSRPWDGVEPQRACCSLDDIHDARRVAGQLGIPFYVMNFEEEFRQLVVEDFIDEYHAGRTPNPCVRCNQRIKFALLMERIRELEADFVATGHYARIITDETGTRHLLKGVDRGKDQSYFLFTLTQEQLSRVLFPVGEMTKEQVREVARRVGLRVAEKGESQEICFVSDDDYVRFLREEGDGRDMSGNIVHVSGKVVGRHRGTYGYTIGQRRGLGIAWHEPLYVVAIDAGTREVIVGGRSDLSCGGLIITDLNWITPQLFPLRAECRIRYRHGAVPCSVEETDAGVRVLFDDPEQGVTPGQAAVFYRGEEVLGGGWIASGLPVTAKGEGTCA